MALTPERIAELERLKAMMRQPALDAQRKAQAVFNAEKGAGQPARLPTDKAKGGFNLGSQTITMAIDNADTGQILLDTASNSTARYSIKIAHGTLGTIYAQALVMGGTRTYGDVNTAATRQVTTEYTILSATETGIVTV